MAEWILTTIFLLLSQMHFTQKVKKISFNWKLRNFADASQPMSQAKLNQISRKTRKINPRSLIFVYMIKYRNIKYTQNLFCLSPFHWSSRENVSGLWSLVVNYVVSKQNSLSQLTATAFADRTQKCSPNVIYKRKHLSEKRKEIDDSETFSPNVPDSIGWSAARAEIGPPKLTDRRRSASTLSHIILSWCLAQSENVVGVSYALSSKLLLLRFPTRWRQ